MATNEIMTKMILDRWYALNKQCMDLVNSMPDEQLLKEIAPGKNRGVYLLGHLVAVHDDMLRLLDFGDKMYPELAEPFINSPDKTIIEIPAVAELKEKWHQLDALLTEKINSLPADEWFARHTAVSDEDFAKEPHRNKLNIMLTRSTHLAYHLGQMVLVG